MLSSDHGDIVALADETGEVFARYAYGPYGEAEGITTRQTGKVSESLAAEIAAAQPLRYAGYCYDTWSGDYYLQARYYDADTKQFISKDPAEADGEQSAYQYCAGDPVHQVDPTGLWGWGALGRAFTAVKRSVVRTVRRAATVVRSTARKVTRRAVTAVKHAKTRVVQKAKAASSWAGGQAKRARNRVAAIRAAAQKRATARKAESARKKAAAIGKSKAAAKRAAASAQRQKEKWREYTKKDGLAADDLRTSQLATAATSTALGVVAVGLMATGVGAPAGLAVAAAVFGGLSMGLGTARKQVDSSYSTEKYTFDMGVGFLSIAGAGAAPLAGAATKAGGYCPGVVMFTENTVDATFVGLDLAAAAASN